MTRLPAGATVRFRVTNGRDRYGSSWSVKTTQGTDDVYVSHRDGGRWVHASLHHDGRWHYAITAAGQELVPGAPGYLGVSRDHGEIAPGWLHAMRITVAASELRSGWREAARSRDFVDVPVHDNFDAVSVDVLLGASNAAAIRVDNAFMVAELELGDGGLAVVVARPMDLDAPVRVALERQITEAVQDLRGFGWDGQSMTRVVINGGNGDGYLRQIEVAVDPD